jgi:hypothetical protein
VGDNTFEIRNEIDFGAWMESSSAFGIITKGGYMGFARPGTREGDLVCIIHGYDVLIIIWADEGDKFAIVGGSE